MRVVKNAHTGGALTVPPPVNAPIQYIKCDRDQACDYAKFRISTRNGPVFLCGHHFHEHEIFLYANKFEVINVNA